MARDLHALLAHCIVQELVVSWRPRAEDLLDDVIAVDILRHFLDVVAKIRLKQFEVGLMLNDLDNLLDRPSAMSIFADTNRIHLHRLDDPGQLLVRAVFGQFLNEIIAEAIYH